MVTLEVYRGRGVQPWRWRLRARNGKIIADGAEGYATRGSVRRAAKRLVLVLRLGRVRGPVEVPGPLISS
jgi:uncharacterized protein YegP (UPF0339 family)